MLSTPNKPAQSANLLYKAWNTLFLYWPTENEQWTLNGYNICLNLVAAVDALCTLIFSQLQQVQIIIGELWLRALLKETCYEGQWQAL